MSEGACECGEVRYRLTTDPIVVNCCHCRDCQTITGSAFALNAMIETGAIEVTQGSPVVRSLERGERGDTRAWRCGRCETLPTDGVGVDLGEARMARLRAAFA